jgi:hypothetical protein
MSFRLGGRCAYLCVANIVLSSNKPCAFCMKLLPAVWECARAWCATEHLAMPDLQSIRKS